MMFNKLMFFLPLVVVAGLLFDGSVPVAATSSSYHNKLRRGDGDSDRRQLASASDEAFDSASHDNSHDVASATSSDAAAMESSSDESSSQDVASSTSVGISDEAFDSSSHDNSHDVASASSSDVAAMESSSPDGSSSPDDDLEASSASDEAFDSASHDNSHDLASASSSDEAMESNSTDGSSPDDLEASSVSDEAFDSSSHDNSHDVAMSSADDETETSPDDGSSSSSSHDLASALSSFQHLPVVITAPQGEEDYTSHDSDTAAVEDASVVIIAPPASSSAAVSVSSSDDGPGFGCQSISDIVCGQEVLSKLCSLLPPDIEENLQAGGPWTLFAPTDAAITEVEDVLNSLSGAKVRRIIEFHAHQGTVQFPSDLVCSEKLLMVSGDLSRTKCVKKEETGLKEKYQKGNGSTKLPKILLPSLRACNGIIHLLDAVMFPVPYGSSTSEVTAEADDAKESSSLSHDMASDTVSASVDEVSHEGSAKNNAKESGSNCASKESCRDCLDDATSTCGWVPSEGCLESCNIIADIACYNIQSFNRDNNNLMTGDDVCVVAGNDLDDTTLCNSQTDCTSCVETNLVSETSSWTTCQWFQEFNYCGSGCGMAGCGETVCSTASDEDGQDMTAMVVDAPIPSLCVTDSDCNTSPDSKEDLYCATGTCLPQGGCFVDTDCVNPSNEKFKDTKCVGYLFCDTAMNRCDRQCTGFACPEEVPATDCSVTGCDTRIACQGSVTCVVDTCDANCKGIFFDSSGTVLEECTGGKP